MRKFIFFAISILICQGAVHEDIGNADDFFDHFLAILLQDSEVINQIEPVAIPNIQHGSFEAWNGKVRGVASLKRDGHCTYSISDEDNNGNKQNTVSLRAQVSNNDVRFSMDYKVKVLFVTVSGVMEGKVGDFAASTSFSLNEKDGTNLNSFKVVRFGNFEITRVSTNLAKSSWIMRLVANNIANKNRSQIVQSLETGIADYLRSLLKDIDLGDL